MPELAGVMTRTPQVLINTAVDRKIPLDQYADIRRTQLRFRRVPIAISVLSLACVVAFVIAGKPLGGLILVGFATTAWSMFARPLHKRKYREALAKLPSWEIEPD